MKYLLVVVPCLVLSCAPTSPAEEPAVDTEQSASLPEAPVLEGSGEGSEEGSGEVLVVEEPEVEGSGDVPAEGSADAPAEGSASLPWRCGVASNDSPQRLSLGGHLE